MVIILVFICICGYLLFTIVDLSFSALMLLVQSQEGHTACKKTAAANHKGSVWVTWPTWTYSVEKLVKQKIEFVVMYSIYFKLFVLVV